MASWELRKGRRWEVRVGVGCTGSTKSDWVGMGDGGLEMGDGGSKMGGCQSRIWEVEGQRWDIGAGGAREG